MINLEPKVKQTLTNINFIKRYETLSNTFNELRTPTKERLRYIDGEIIMDSIEQLGYKVKFESKEKFFKAAENQIDNYMFSCHIILYNGMVDLVWVIKENGNLIFGIPLSEYSRLMINPQYKIKKLIFGTYEDLDEILRINFEMFEDFKQVLVKS